LFKCPFQPELWYDSMTDKSNPVYSSSNRLFIFAKIHSQSLLVDDSLIAETSEDEKQCAITEW